MAEVKDRPRNWSSGQIKRQPAKKKAEQFTPGERRRMTQLVVCLLLFGVVFMGRGLPPGPLSELGATVSGLIHQNTDFRAAFSKVGHSISEGEPVVETFGVLWSEVFGSGEGESGPVPDPEGTPPEGTPPEGEVLPGVGQEDTPAEGAVPPSLPEEPSGEAAAQTPPPPEPKAKVEPTAADTATPVMGVLTSGFGYRTHPIDGEYKHHDGLDIQADEGTPILAFASGQVDYIGESPAYGLYLQLKHSDGRTTFYAHCSEITVKNGQSVAVGEQIAKVGSTGNVTGAHLHFELKKDGVRVDPADYIETQS